MRTEIKAALVLGLFVILGTVIWGINSGRKTADVPLDVTADDLKNAPPINLASDERPSAPQKRETVIRPLVTLDASRPDNEDAGPDAAPERADATSVAAPTPDRRREVPLPPLAPTRDEQRDADSSTRSRDADEPPLVRVATRERSQPDPSTGLPTPSATGEKPLVPERSGSLRTDLTRPAAAGASHVIRPGDTFISIAREKLGAERYWKAIQAANPGLDPHRLHEGQTIRLPSADELARSDAQPAGGAGGAETPPPASGVARGGQTYVVAKGDTLTGIARNVLRDETRWLEIYELNRETLSSPNHIVEGMELRLPEPRTKEHG